MKNPLSCLILLLLGFLACASSTLLSLPGPLSCLVDFNSDKLSDLVTARAAPGEQTIIQVAIYDGSQTIYASKPSLEIVISGTVVGVSPGDFNGDGQADLLVSGRATGQAADNREIFLHLYLGAIDSFINPNEPIVLPPSLDPVMLLDWNSDQLTDLYGLNTAGERTIWINQFKQSTGPRFIQIPHNITEINLQISDSLSSPTVEGPLFTSLASPAASSFVDLNGDCISDLFIVSAHPVTKQIAYEFWLNTRSGFVLHSNYIFPIEFKDSLGIPVWEDIDADGTMDFMVSLCSPAISCDSRNELHIFYNHQISMCDSVWESGGKSCRAQQGLCTADEKFQFARPNKEINQGNSLAHTVIQRNSFKPYQFSTVYANSNGNSPLIHPPIQLRLGDYDLDGFPDLLLTVQLYSEDIIPQNRAFSTRYYQNIGISTGKRSFIEQSNIFSMENAYFATFLDVENAGSLDILYGFYDSARFSFSSHLQWNPSEFDAYFLTATVSNSACPAWCPSGEKFPSPKPYGATLPGAVVKFTLTDLQGSKSPRTCVQFSSVNYLALSRPYCFFGLSRTNNYIEEFFIGIPSRADDYSQLWVAMIPNSQIIVFPYPPQYPEDWLLELYISPSQKLFSVFLTLIVILFLNGLLIGYFHYCEQLEDEKEKRKNELLFTF